MPTPRPNNSEIARQIAAKISEQVRKAAGRGLDAARVFIVGRLKEAVSVPAPRALVKSRSGDRYYRATSSAIPGAPPRKLSGRLRSSIWSKKVSDKLFIIGANAKSGGFSYPAWLEHNRRHPHPFIAPTVQRFRMSMMAIIGRQFRLSWRSR